MRLSPAVLELDSMVVNVELTLTSIVQGVALTFLIENTRSVLSIHNAISWLYWSLGTIFSTSHAPWLSVCFSPA
jgi:hypothetical protein